MHDILERQSLKSMSPVSPAFLFVMLVYLVQIVSGQTTMPPYALSSCYAGDCSDSNVINVINALQQTVYGLETMVQQLRQEVNDLQHCCDHLPPTSETPNAFQTTPSDDITVPIRPTGCPDGFKYFPEAFGCYRIVSEALNWTQSQAICPQLDPRARLVVITNAQQSDAIVNYTMSLNSSSVAPCYYAAYGGAGFYTSGQRVIANDCSTTFVWKPYPNTSLPLTYTDWFIGEPNCNSGHEGCIMSWSAAHYQWNDVDCWLTGCPICELDPSLV